MIVIETAISVDYPNLGTSQSIELKLKIDKLPDEFTFTPVTEAVGNTQYTSNTISLQSINAPTAIWKQHCNQCSNCNC